MESAEFTIRGILNVLFCPNSASAPKCSEEKSEHFFIGRVDYGPTVVSIEIEGAPAGRQKNQKKKEVLLMGGWHIPYRATNGSNYIAVASKLKLPSSCGCQNNSSPTTYDGVFPEFFHGFYKGSYGIDIGVVYKTIPPVSGDQFYLTFHTLAGTGNPYQDPIAGQEKKINAAKGATITLKAYLSGNTMVAEAWDASGTTKLSDSLVVNLTSGAATAFKAGGIINREICIASNRTNMIPCAAYFSDTKFYDTTMTTTAYQYVKMALANSTKKIFADAGTPLNSSRYGCPTSTESNGFVSDVGSCDLR